MPFIRICLCLLLLCPKLLGAAYLGYEPAKVYSPQPPREFRAAWLATVGNIDWPSKPGLPVAQQKAELIGLLDRAVQLKLNAIIFQVRPASDAVYASPIEPWSEYLTGRMGQAPSPAYDPLAMVIDEAHQRGLELHAWFNPFRAHHSGAKSPVAASHISRAHPELVHRYGEDQWLDPGEPAVRDFVLHVVLDVVKRYDVDGIHFDDYFYPYPVKDAKGADLDYPDMATWKKYGSQGQDRDAWRRQNINKFVQSVYAGIKETKPWVKFGISPFGIWRPFYPPSVRGFDSYAKLYADSRMWLANGWVDYLSPQLYWAVNSPEQSFPALLQWWRAQNLQKRHIWPGLYDSAEGKKFTNGEIARQIDVTRTQAANGTVHFHLRNLEENADLNGSLRRAYWLPALVPTSPWLDASLPEKPRLNAIQQNSSVHLDWGTGGGKTVRNWVLQTKINGAWQTEIFPPGRTTTEINGIAPDAIVLLAADRLGNLSQPASVVPKKPAPTAPHTVKKTT